MDRGFSTGHAGYTRLPSANTMAPPIATAPSPTPSQVQLQLASGVANIGRHDDLPLPPCPRLQDNMQFRARCQARVSGEIEFEAIEIPEGLRGQEAWARKALFKYLHNIFKLFVADKFINDGEYYKQKQDITLVNEILNLMTSCGTLNLAALGSILKSKPDDESRFYIANAGESFSLSGIDYQSVVDNCRYIERKAREYSTSTADFITLHRQDCLEKIANYVSHARAAGESSVFINSMLKKIQGGHLLHVICAAAWYNIGTLAKSRDPAHLWRAMELAGNLCSVPGIFSVDTFNKLAPMVEQFMHRLFDRLCAGGCPPQEATDRLRALFGPILTKLGDDASSRFEARLSAIVTTREAFEELETLAKKISRLNLTLGFESGVKVTPVEMKPSEKKEPTEEQEPSKEPERYGSRAHSFIVLGYLRCLGRIDYYEPEEIMPLLDFVAERTREEEPLPRRESLRDYVLYLRKDLQRRGLTYAGKARAIRIWLATDPFRCG
jgi:hypothetical protein